MADSPTFENAAQAVEFLLSKHVDPDLEAIYSEARRAVCGVLEPGEKPGENLAELVAQCRERNKAAVRAAAFVLNSLNVATAPTDASGMPIGAGPPRLVDTRADEVVRRGARKE